MDQSATMASRATGRRSRLFDIAAVMGGTKSVRSPQNTNGGLGRDIPPLAHHIFRQTVPTTAVLWRWDVEDDRTKLDYLSSRTARYEWVVFPLPTIIKVSSMQTFKEH